MAKDKDSSSELWVMGGGTPKKVKTVREGVKEVAKRAGDPKGVDLVKVIRETPKKKSKDKGKGKGK